MRQYLQAGGADEMHLVLSPTVPGQGEALLAGIDLTALGMRGTRHAGSPQALHVGLGRAPGSSGEPGLPGRQKR